MTVELKGIDSIADKVENRLQTVISESEDKCLKNGAEVIKKAIVNQFAKFKDTGASIDEIKITKTIKEKGKSKVILYWDGPKKRYKIIHLNEYGYTKHGKKKSKKTKPSGFGAIQRALLISREDYKIAMKRGLSEK